MFFYRIPAPNEAMVVSGSKRGSDGGQFRVVTGRGAFVLPWAQKARWLSLDLREALLSESCVTKLRIPLTVEAVAVFKVGDDNSSITNAARRFLDQQDGMERLTAQVLAGHLRSIVGSLTVEEIIGDRNRVAQEVKGASADEMEKLGLVVDAFQIQEIKDDTGYIKNLAAPHAAAVARDARIAAAQADQAATEKEQEANALKAGFVREAEIKQAGYRAEIEQAQAAADQAGPLARARATQEVTKEQTRLSALEAEKRQKELVVEVEKPADAEAYRTIRLAEADRDAMKARAAALAGGNQGMIAANKMVEQLPALVEAASKGLSGANIVLVNGAEGITDLIANLATQGYAIYDAVKGGLPAMPARPGDDPRASSSKANGVASPEELQSAPLADFAGLVTGGETAPSGTVELP
jgi:flotillin